MLELQPFDCLLMVHLLIRQLRFGVSLSTTSKYFQNWIDAIIVKILLNSLTQQTLGMNMHQVLRDLYRTIRMYFLSVLKHANYLYTSYLNCSNISLRTKMLYLKCSSFAVYRGHISPSAQPHIVHILGLSPGPNWQVWLFLRVR